MEVKEVVVRLELLDIASLTREQVRDGFSAVSAVRGWCDVMDARLARRLNTLAESQPSIFPEADIAEASRRSRSAASKAARRAKTLDDVPEFEDALAAGEVSAEHVESVGRAMKRLKPEQREQLKARGERLKEIAAKSTPEEFEDHMKVEVARLDHREGGERLARQKRAIRLRSFTDKETGMVIIRCELDPETGLRVLSRIEKTADRLFHNNTPADCPDGDGKQEYLRAAAFIRLIERRNTKQKNETSEADTADEQVEDELIDSDPIDGDVDEPVAPTEPAVPRDPAPPVAADPHDDAGLDITVFDNRYEMVIIIDLHTLLTGLHDESIINNGHNLDLPIESYRRMACTAAIIPVVLDGAGVALDEGQAKRLATHRQRLALLAMYDTCAMPGCTVSTRHCQPHHIRWSTNFGDTDLNNLIPVCSRHHHALHEGRWKHDMHTDRSLTITYPNGAIQNTGPPNTERRPKPERNKAA